MAVSERRLWKCRSQRHPSLSRRCERPLKAERTHWVAAEVRTDVAARAEASEIASEEQGLPPVRLSELAGRILEEGAEGRQSRQSKPLKINRDLLLFEAKKFRRRANRSTRHQRRQHQFLEAEKCFRKVTRMDPTDARAYVGLGRLFEDQGRLDDARRIYDDGCAVSEGRNPHLWTSLGNLEAKENNFDRARACFDSAIAADRSHEAAWNAWGQLEKRLGNPMAARDCWIKAMRFAKGRSSARPFQLLAQLAEELGLKKQARYCEGTKTELGSDDYVLWTSWAIMEGKDSNLGLMREMFEKAIELNPRNRYAYSAWGKLEQDMGNVETARRLYREGHRKNPADPTLLQSLALLESECNRSDLARAYFQMVHSQALGVDPKHQYSWQAWGVMECHLRNYEKARDLFQRGIWANPNSRSALFIFQAWGRMEEELGNLDLARSLFKYGIKVDPRSEAVWNAWIQLEEREENFLRADELRNYSLQERFEVALPKDFTTLEGHVNIVEEFFTKLIPFLDDGWLLYGTKRSVMSSVYLRELARRIRERDSGVNIRRSKPSEHDREAAMDLPDGERIGLRDGNLAWEHLESLKIKEGLPSASHIFGTEETRVVQMHSVAESAHRSSTWGYALREAFGKNVYVSAVSQLPELDVVSVAVGSLAYFWKRERPFRTALSVDAGDAICFSLAVQRDSQILLWTERTVVVCWLKTSLKGRLLVDSHCLNVQLPTRPTAVFAASDGRTFFGGENGLVYELRLEASDQGEFHQVRHFSSTGGYYMRRLRGVSDSAVRSLCVHESRKEMVVLHASSEVEVLNSEGRRVGYYYDASVELLTVVLVAAVDPELASESDSDCVLTILGSSSDGELCILEMKPGKAVELKQRSATLSAALGRRRSEVVRLLSFSNWKLLVAVTDLDRKPSLTRLKWVSGCLDKSSTPTIIVEKAGRSIRGSWRGVCRAFVPKWRRVWDQLKGLKHPDHPLTQQFFDVPPSLVLFTTEGCLEVEQTWLYTMMLAGLRSSNPRPLARLLEVHDGREIVASAVILAMSEDHSGIHWAVHNGETKHELVDGLYTAFKRLVSLLWRRGLFQIEGGLITVAVRAPTLEWYLRALKRFQDVLSTVLATLPPRQAAGRGWPLETIPSPDYDAIEFLKLLTDRCLNVLHVVQELRHCPYLYSSALWLHPLLLTALFRIKLNSLMTPWRACNDRHFWSLQELTKTVANETPLMDMLEALVWCGWYPERLTMMHLNRNAQLFLTQIEWEPA